MYIPAFIHLEIKSKTHFAATCDLVRVTFTMHRKVLENVFHSNKKNNTYFECIFLKILEGPYVLIHVMANVSPANKIYDINLIFLFTIFMIH